MPVGGLDRPPLFSVLGAPGPVRLLAAAPKPSPGMMTCAWDRCLDTSLAWPLRVSIAVIPSFGPGFARLPEFFPSGPSIPHPCWAESGCPGAIGQCETLAGQRGPRALRFFYFFSSWFTKSVTHRWKPAFARNRLRIMVVVVDMPCGCGVPRQMKLWVSFCETRPAQRIWSQVVAKARSPRYDSHTLHRTQPAGLERTPAWPFPVSRMDDRERTWAPTWQTDQVGRLHPSPRWQPPVRSGLLPADCGLSAPCFGLLRNQAKSG